LFSPGTKSRPETHRCAARDACKTNTPPFKGGDFSSLIVKGLPAYDKPTNPYSTFVALIGPAWVVGRIARNQIRLASPAMFATAAVDSGEQADPWTQALKCCSESIDPQCRIERYDIEAVAGRQLRQALRDWRTMPPHSSLYYRSI
jgi:hypothetical protein